MIPLAFSLINLWNIINYIQTSRTVVCSVKTRIYLLVAPMFNILHNSDYQIGRLQTSIPISMH